MLRIAGKCSFNFPMKKVMTYYSAANVPWLQVKQNMRENIFYFNQ
jgi:hypothetical protein